jgi:hypothetical protein
VITLTPTAHGPKTILYKTLFVYVNGGAIVPRARWIAMLSSTGLKRFFFSGEGDSKQVAEQKKKTA